MNKSRAIALLIVFGMGTAACNKDNDEMKASGNFTVTIENVMSLRDYFANGKTGLITPGNSESFTINAGKGHYLSFATMFVQSNDLFFAPDEGGIALYDSNGDPVTGDITMMVNLWDAGTEVNEEPGTGPNQPPRQSGPNTGPAENGTVKLITEVQDGFTYPAVSDVIMLTLTHDGGTMFTVTIANVSAGKALETPLAPGVWVLHSKDQKPLFKKGDPASAGLEKIAEDGDNSTTDQELTGKSGLVSPLAPGAFVINNALFSIGQPASSALEALAEDGDPSGFTNTFAVPDGGSGPGPAFPGQSYSFTFKAQEGDQLSFATMFVQSNDWFFGVENIDLFDNGVALSGDITMKVKLYDAGTETDEYAGAGNNQPPRQAAPDTGPDENGNVEAETSPGDHVPAVADIVKVTISSQ